MIRNRASEIYSQIKEKGIKAIDEFILNRQSEELFLDFKRSADNGGGKKLHDDDRKNLAKAISGFGNSEGGVIVWGVDCSKDRDGADVASKKVPILNVERYASWIEGIISGCTIPVHSKVENFVIKEKNGEGFLTTFIPSSTRTPHQSVSDYKYYMRAGSNFMPIPHAVLSGMFGRRPQPVMFLMFSVGPAQMRIIENGVKEFSGQVGFMVTNDGLGIARDLFLNAEIVRAPGKKCKIWFDLTDKQNWTGSFAFGFKLGLFTKEGFKLPPHNISQPVILNFSLCPPFDKGLDIKLACGCEGSEISHHELISPKDNIERIYQELIALECRDHSQDLVMRLFNLPPDEISKDDILSPNNPETPFDLFLKYLDRKADQELILGDYSLTRDNIIEWYSKFEIGLKLFFGKNEIDGVIKQVIQDIDSRINGFKIYSNKEDEEVRKLVVKCQNFVRELKNKVDRSMMSKDFDPLDLDKY